MWYGVVLNLLMLITCTCLQLSTTILSSLTSFKYSLQVIKINWMTTMHAVIMVISGLTI